MRRIVKMKVIFEKRPDQREFRSEDPWSIDVRIELDDKTRRQLCILTEAEGVGAEEFEQVAGSIVRALKDG